MLVGEAVPITATRWSVLVFDPGLTTGWAGYDARVGIVVGQLGWNEFAAERTWEAFRIVIERTPFAARRTFDTWPLYVTGAVLAHIHPQPVEFVLPTNLKVAKKWFDLPRGHGIGRHAKDALSHLVYTLVRDHQKTGELR